MSLVDLVNNILNFSFRDSKVTRNVAIGNKTIIGSNSTISDSIIGPNCRIGNGVTITDSYIWDNVVIEDGCSVDKSIIASNVVIRKNCQINAHCVIANDVVLDENITLPASTNLIKDDDVETDHKVVGSKGVGSLFSKDEDPDECEQDSESESSMSTVYSDSSDDECHSPVEEFKSKQNKIF